MVRRHLWRLGGDARRERGAVSPQEFDTQHGRCHLCQRDAGCTYLKTAHVPLYAWVCEDCRDEWVSE